MPDPIEQLMIISLGILIFCIIYSTVQSMLEVDISYHWELSWFEADGDDLVGEAELPNEITDEDIQRLFFYEEGDQEVLEYEHIVRASQRERLNEWLGGVHNIDLNKYDYFVGAVED